MSRPICLLRICSKIFKRYIYNNILVFFTDDKLIFPNKSGLRSGYCCVNQLIAITHKIYKTFDDRLEVRRVFLDIKYDMKVYFLKWYLRKPFQTFTRVFVLLQATSFLSGQMSSCENVNAGFLLCYILGTLLFLIYINTFCRRYVSFFRGKGHSVMRNYLTQWPDGSK